MIPFFEQLFAQDFLCFLRKPSLTPVFRPQIERNFAPKSTDFASRTSLFGRPSAWDMLYYAHEEVTEVNAPNRRRRRAHARGRRPHPPGGHPALPAARSRLADPAVRDGGGALVRHARRRAQGRRGRIHRLPEARPRPLAHARGIRRAHRLAGIQLSARPAAHARASPRPHGRRGHWTPGGSASDVSRELPGLRLRADARRDPVVGAPRSRLPRRARRRRTYLHNLSA